MNPSLLDNPILDVKEDLGGFDGAVQPVHQEDTKPRTLPTIMAEILETTPVSNVVRSKYLQRLKSRGVKKVGGSAIQKKNQVKAVVGDVSGAVEVLATVSPLGRCEACMAELLVTEEESQEGMGILVLRPVLAAEARHSSEDDSFSDGWSSHEGVSLL